VARENNVIILSDEIYGQLNHNGNHISISRFYPEGTIISSGLSKWCGAGGWRLGTFSFPQNLKPIMEMMAVVASETYTSVSAPIQHAAVFAFRGGSEIENYLWHTRRILKGLGKECVDILQSAGINVHLPEGAFYLFPDCSPLKEKLTSRGIVSSSDLCYRLLEETGVAVLPGSDFNRDSTELTLRMAYVDFDGAGALGASHIIPLHEQLPEDFFKQHCARVLEGVKKMAEWLN
jgi:aspartate aminotransferase